MIGTARVRSDTIPRFGCAPSFAAATPAQPGPQTEFLRGAAGGGKVRSSACLKPEDPKTVEAMKWNSSRRTCVSLGSLGQIGTTLGANCLRGPQDNVDGKESPLSTNRAGLTVIANGWYGARGTVRVTQA